jgi:hypothetical protein
VVSPKKRFGQGPGWSKGRYGDHRFIGQTDGETADNQSWRKAGSESGDRCSNHGAHTDGGMAAGFQGEKGLFATGPKSPSKDLDEYGKGELEGSGIKASVGVGQYISDMEGTDQDVNQQNLAETDMGTEAVATNHRKRKAINESAQIWEEATGLTATAKEKAYETKRQSSNCGESPAKANTGGSGTRKSGGVYVGQWNQIKEQMEWNLMEGSKESFCPSVATTSQKERDVQAVQPKGTFKRSQQKSRGSERHVGSSGPGSKVGDKRREHADGLVDSSPGSNKLQPHSDRGAYSGWKKARASKGDTSDETQIQAAATMQSRPSQ